MSKRIASFVASALTVIVLSSGCDNAGEETAPPTPSPAVNAPPAAPDAVTDPKSGGKPAEAGGGNMPSTDMVR